MAKILKIGDLAEFIDYLVEQIGQPYLWGGQHTKLTPSNYVSVITDKESDTTNRKNAIAYCKKKFDAGATALYAYDCSGLGAYFLYNLKKIISSDTTANGLRGLCDAADAPARGFWVFRLDDKGKAVHIGYMVTDTEVIHAKGRSYGVCKEKFRASFWHVVGKPRCFSFDEPEPAPEPEPTPEPSTHRFVKVVGGSVNVRKGNGIKYDRIGTAHNARYYREHGIDKPGDELPCFGQADTDPYWYEVEFNGERGYISANAKYTEIICKV